MQRRGRQPIATPSRSSSRPSSRGSSPTERCTTPSPVGGPIRRRALIRESILDAVGGVSSLPERDFDDIRRGAGLPAPSRQRQVRAPNGRYYLDASWDEWGVAAEIHGLPHIEVAQWSADLVRANEVVIEGPRLVAFTSYATRHQKPLVADQLTRLLRSAGWDGP